MAFVFRAKRDFKLSESEENNRFPGEYYQEPQLIKNIEKQSSEFQSKSQRGLNTKKFNTPGPGSYEKNMFEQDVFANLNKIKRPKNIIETIKLSVIPTEIQQFLEKYQSIAFNSRGKRFNYKNEELEKEKPGPGAYSPDINYSQTNKRNNSLDKNNNNYYINSNNNNIINDNNNNSVISNDKNNQSLNLNLNLKRENSSKNNFSGISSSNNNKSTDSTSANSNNILNNKLVKITKSFNSEYRVESIPSKNNLGYDIDENGDKKMIIAEKDINQMDGTKRDSAGPGQYDIPMSWDKNIINWKNTKDEKNEKYKEIKSRKNLSPLTQLEKDYLTNSQRETKNNYNYRSKTKTEINYSPSNYTRSRLFNFFMNLRYDKHRNIAEKKDDMDQLFKDTPGPGYYSPESLNEKNINFSSYGFNSNIPRFKTSININNDLGPGYYYNRSKPKKVEKPKYMLGPIPNKEENIYALKLSLSKENYKVPGPGSYEIEGSLIKEDITKNQNFGSNDMRFKKNYKIKENLPGPGSYEVKSIFHQDKKETNKKNNIFKNYKNDLEIIKELEKVPKVTSSSPPPVGFYNSNIIKLILI